MTWCFHNLTRSSALFRMLIMSVLELWTVPEMPYSILKGTLRRTSLQRPRCNVRREYGLLDVPWDGAVAHRNHLVGASERIG